MNIFRKIFIPVILFAVLAVRIYAADSEAAELYTQGRKLYLAGEYYDAAKKFERSYAIATEAAVRANSLLAQIGAFRMCKLYYREFNAIELLLERYPEYADCRTLISREYEIAEYFRTGLREPSFWILRWIPWLKDVDRTEELYLKALKRSPYAKEASAAHMKLAIFYDLEGKTQPSLVQLRLILQRHPKSPESKYARLALANGLFELARRGDGDSRYVNEAVLEFNEFCKRYPDSSEIEFARTKLAQARDIQAERLLEIAEYYRKNGRSEASERYLAKVMGNFPDSKSAPEAEKILSDISENYLPGDFPGRSEARRPDLRSYAIPETKELILVSPLDKDSHYLLPVPDLKGELLQPKKIKEVKK